MKVRNMTKIVRREENSWFFSLLKIINEGESNYCYNCLDYRKYQTAKNIQIGDRVEGWNKLIKTFYGFNQPIVFHSKIIKSHAMNIKIKIIIHFYLNFIMMIIKNAFFYKRLELGNSKLCRYFYGLVSV